jgi:hypothetical protein
MPDVFLPHQKLSEAICEIESALATMKAALK